MFYGKKGFDNPAGVQNGVSATENANLEIRKYEFENG
jgi:hypothetical protein